MVKTRLPVDYTMLGYLITLLVFGLLMLTSASAVQGLHLFKDQYFFIKHQVFFGLVPGLFLAYAMLRTRYTFWQEHARLVMALSIGILILVLIPGVGSTYDKGARSWFSAFGFSFQPAEFVKLGLILFFSAYLIKYRQKLSSWQEGFIPSLIVGLTPVFLLLLQPDVGTASIVFGITLLLLFFAGAQLRHLGVLLLIGLVGLGCMVALAPYRLHRVMTFLHPELDPKGIGYQINQAYLGIGSGGLLGLGLGHSRQKFQYLPEVQADSIFAVVGEEMGFIITAGFIILLILTIRRGYLIAQTSDHEYGMLVAAGISSWLAIQSFLNIGAIIGLLPLTGVPLPFVSHGGSSLMTMLAASGLLLNISRTARLSSNK